MDDLLGFPFLVCAALAVNQVIETWQHGSIFRAWYARAEARDGFVAELLTCPFCLGHWVALLVVVGFLIVPAGARILILALAVTRLAQLLNDFSYPWQRTKKETVAETPMPKPPWQPVVPDRPGIYGE